VDTKRSVVRIVIFLAVTPALISGCATDRVDLVDSGVLTLEQHSTGKVFIAWSSAYEDGDGFVVAGVLMRHDHVGLPVRAHVDAAILSPDGRVLDESRTPDIYVPPHVTGRAQKLRRFKVRFTNVPPQGSSVRLVCHSALHDDTT